MARAMGEIEARFKVSAGEIKKSLNRSKDKLFAFRTNRPRPHLDDKILVDWNGLMISSLAFGSRVLNEPRYKEAAEKSAQFILKKLVRTDGRLLHRYRDGHAAILGSIEDYAFFIHGLIDLYEATFKVEYLFVANQLTEDMVKLFEDKENGGFFFSGSDAEELLFRDKEIYDGAIPSGNAIAALNLVRLWRFTFDEQWEKHIKKFFDGFAQVVAIQPNGYAQTLIALDFLLGPSKEIVIAEGGDGGEIQGLLNLLYNSFIPNKIVIFRPINANEAKDIIKLSPFIDSQKSINSKTTVYVCEDYVCKFPTSSLDEIRALLR